MNISELLNYRIIEKFIQIPDRIVFISNYTKFKQLLEGNTYTHLIFKVKIITTNSITHVFYFKQRFGRVSDCMQVGIQVARRF